MIKLTINNKPVEVTEGSTLLQASLQAGVEIPTLCHNGELEHFTSCMLCLVKDQASGKLLPSCSARAMQGMTIISEDEEVREARKLAQELLMSEHAGDCEAPCRVACPAFMDIPLMNRLIQSGRFDDAREVVMKDIALPGVLGRICPAPCEGACKRKPVDEAVSVCLLKRSTADKGTTPVFKKPVATQYKVAVVGAGPAGLAAAFYLQLKGIQAEVFDKNPLPGGTLRYSIPDEELEKEVLDKEIELIKSTGVIFQQDTAIDAQGFKELCHNYDAVILATGNYSQAMNDWGLANNGKQILVDKSTYLTNIERVFAIGNANRSMQLAIRSAAQGKEVAVAVWQLLKGEKVTGEVRIFNSTLGKLIQEEYAEFLKEATKEKRVSVAAPGLGFDNEAAIKEAERCMHCDCRKADNCKLRDFSEQYDISKKRFAYSLRKPVKKIIRYDVLVYEPGKCIKCGICVRLTAKQEEQFGFTFIGRGFDVEIGVPFNHTLEQAFKTTAGMVADACPTGALARHTSNPE